MNKIVKTIVIVIMLIICFKIIQSYNFNGFKFAHFYEGRTKVTRDSNEKYNGEWSYKIESTDYNDFMVYQTIKVKKNTAYKVSCMVKTKNVESEQKNGSGFNICIKDRLEKSQSIIGTTEWQELTFYFDSKNNETVDIGFRLGDNSLSCKGTAWFSNIKIEVGRKKLTNEWDFAVFMINNTELEVDGERISKKITEQQANIVKNSFEGFKETLEHFTNDNIKVNYELIEIDDPLINISRDEETGCYIAKEDCYDLIDKYIYKDKIYDHVFIVTNIGDEIKTNEIEWIGLGGMKYNNLGYSNIRVSNGSIGLFFTSYTNHFPEEVILHEFLHTLEKNSIELGYPTIRLHDFKEHGYINDVKLGLKVWYRDYITNSIKGTKNGIREKVYYTQPVSKKNFISRENVTKIIYERQNLIQKINESISKIL